MNSHGFPRRIPKRRRTTKASQLLDLNLLPVEGAGDEGSPSSSGPVSHSQASGTVATETPQLLVPVAAAGLHIGMNSFPIDVEAIDDDVVIYSSRRSLPQARQQSTGTGPITVIIDDDSETIAGPAGEALDEHVNTLLSLGMNPRHDRSRASNNSVIINLSDTPETDSIVRTVMQAPPVPVEEVPKEPKFQCPVCMNELVDASSTICGHIFCQGCIKTSIKRQKKCPTCRRKLTTNNIHRVYLPSTE